MAGVTKEEIARAKELDLLTYFKLVEPGNLKLVGKEYRHKVHSSLTISKDSLWCWHCIGLRGRTALKYLIDVEKVPYVEAVREINRIQGGVVHSSQPVSLSQPRAEPEAPRDFKLPKLNDQSRKDDVITFEELGVDSLMVDEAHYFKNAMVTTKMTRVAGISQTESQKASDMYMKCMYMDELTDGHGIVFATGTPISNSMTEMYIMMRYLQYGLLEQEGLLNFDAWASTFGESVTAIELAPEGNGYRSKTRFAKFYNLPELMNMFKQCADIQTADMLKLPVPKITGGKPTIVKLPPSELQRQMVAALGERAEAVRNRLVAPNEDNMLRITNDGRKLALDQRLMNPLLPDDPDSKANACVERVFTIWERTKAQRSTQMIFCDLSTPRADGFDVYNDIRDKLVARGIPKEEVQFIHDADTEAKKAELFGKVRSGAVRVLMGSTQKMGAGTNVQTRLCALHHLDCPWRPADIAQRNGRMVRQGNMNKEVSIFIYITETTHCKAFWMPTSTRNTTTNTPSGISPVRRRPLPRPTRSTPMKLPPTTKR